MRTASIDGLGGPSYFLLFVTTLFLGSIACMTTSADDDVQQPLDKYTAAVWTSPTQGKLNYRFRTPAEVDATKSYPLILLLHGAGGRGDDNIGQLKDAGVLSLLDKASIGAKRDCYVIAGQVPNDKLWVDVPWTTLDHEMPPISDSMRMMLECVDAFVADPAHRVDAKRIYVAGLSMGGYGTWDAIQRRPDFFAAAVPICGGGDKRLAAKLTNLPIWAWHGDKDGAINVSRSRDMVAAIRSASEVDGANKPIKYTEVAGRGHNVWVPALESQEMWEWLFAQRRE